MTKALKILGFSLVGVVALIAILSVSLSPKQHMERSAVINASPAVVFEQINNLKNCVKWQPWGMQDPNIKYTYEGPEAGVGTKVVWESEKMGNGSQWIVESEQDKHVKMGLQFAQMGGTYSGDINLEPAEGGTKVTWTYDGDVTGAGMASSAMGKIMGMFIDSMLGGDYEKGLSNLKALAESQPQPQPNTTPTDSPAKK